MAGDTPDFTEGIVFLDQKLAVYSGSQFAAVQGLAKYVNGSTTCVDGVAVTFASYTVPAGKTFYCYGFSYGWDAQAASISCTALFLDNGGAIIQFCSQAGHAVAFDTPIVFAAGHAVSVYTFHFGDGAVARAVRAAYWGVEI